jgi:hypothetical protein
MRALLNCLCVVVVITVVSCNDEPSEIGSNFFSGGSLNMSAIDTITAIVSTVKFDSMVTGDASRLLVGYHQDEDLGVTTSAAYFQIGPDYVFSLDKLFTSYSRSELRLIHEGYSCYDTLTEITFSVHRLTEVLETDDYYYNTNSFKYDPIPMGTVTYKPRPNSKDTVTIALTDDLGRDIVRLAQNAGPQVSSTNDFVNYFDGFVLIPSTTNGPVVGFNLAAQLRIYYNDKTQTPSVERYLSASRNLLSKYNKISSNTAATNLEPLKVQRYSLGSRETDNKSYIQCGAGLGLRVSMPYLRRIMIDNPDLTVVNATLQFLPTKDSKGINIPMPKTLQMTSIDFQNDLSAVYSDIAVLIEDVDLGRDTRYVVDITGYVKIQLLTEEFNDDGLIFTPDDATLRGTVDRLYIGDQHSDRPMKVTLNVLTYNKNK